MILLSLVMIPPLSFAQRHFRGGQSIEVNAGSRLSGSDYNEYFNASFSHYSSKKSYLKIGLNYLAPTFEIGGETEKTTICFLDTKWFLSLLTDNKSFWLNIGGGAFIGYENVPSLDDYIKTGVILDKEYKSTATLGAIAGIELEYFFYKNAAFLIAVNQMYNPMSNLNNWHTIGSIGLKFIFATNF